MRINEISHTLCQGCLYLRGKLAFLGIKQRCTTRKYELETEGGALNSLKLPSMIHYYRENYQTFNYVLHTRTSEIFSKSYFYCYGHFGCKKESMTVSSLTDWSTTMLPHGALLVVLYKIFSRVSERCCCCTCQPPAGATLTLQHHINIYIFIYYCKI